MPPLWSCSCGALNRPVDRQCEACARPRVGDEPIQYDEPKGAVPNMPSVCPADGGRLWANGWCPTGDGYFAHMSCPFACPICRHPLSWDGGCETCHGCTTGEREDWTFPGDRHEFDGTHWRMAFKGPRRACTREENVIQARAVAAILAKSILTTPVGERPPRRPTREERREGRPEAGGGQAAC